MPIRIDSPNTREQESYSYQIQPEAPVAVMSSVARPGGWTNRELARRVFNAGFQSGRPQVPKGRLDVGRLIPQINVRR